MKHRPDWLTIVVAGDFSIPDFVAGGRLLFGSSMDHQRARTYVEAIV